MKLFTVILEYRGGTYISQVQADDVSKVLSRWLDQISDEEFRQWMLSQLELDSSLRGSNPVPINGISNVWCQSALVDSHLVLINIVATASD